jgi:hypothetical protein
VQKQILSPQGIYSADPNYAKDTNGMLVD